ncbi:hypothetical protein WUBG_09146, partial [Wuchereria bancrofti]
RCHETRSWTYSRCVTKHAIGRTQDVSRNTQSDVLKTCHETRNWTALHIVSFGIV